MSGLWGDDEVEVPANGEFSSGGGDFELIPANTRVLFEIEQVTMEEPNNFNDTEYINVRWSILKPDLYTNRKVFQKIRVFDNDKEKRMKARKMLAAIDVNADSRLTKYAEKHKKTLEEFTTEDLTLCLVGKSMSGVIMVWKDNDTKEPKGNWVSSIAPANGAKIPEVAKPAVTKKPIVDEDEDLPF